MSDAKITPSVAVESFCVTVDASPEGEAGALRLIADRIESEQLCLVGLWSTGFGEAWEATIQVVYERDGDTA